jgi:Zn-dependent protease
MAMSPDNESIPGPPAETPGYPPHPDVYRQWPRSWVATDQGIAHGPSANSAADALPGWRCHWCGTPNSPAARSCATCGAPVPDPGVPAYWLPPPPGQVGAPAYPPFAPDGRVQPDALRQPAAGARGRRARAGAAVGLGATLIAVLSKLSLVAKFALPLLSALASLGVYAAIFGWQFGLGIVLLLFVHEMGHVIAIRSKGLPASLPIFIPLLGAAVLMRRMPQSAKDEAEIAIAGPFAGGVASLACYFAYVQTSSHLWLALAYFSFFINLINLVPVSPLDGGRVAGAISRWVWPLGLVVVAVLFYYTHSILFILIGWLGLLQTISAFQKTEVNERYYRVPLGARISITLLYLLLAALLAVGMLQTQQALAGNPSAFMLGH